MGPTCQPLYFAKTDFRSAFRVLGLNPRSWKWLIMYAKHPEMGIKYFFIDKCLPFGASISCSHFQQVSDAIKHVLQYLAKKKDFVNNYLDDFLFLARTLLEYNRLVCLFLDLCERINFPVLHEKMQWAATVIVFLGILLDGVLLVLCLPLEKRVWAESLINQFLHRHKATVKELQVLCGYLNFLCRAIFPGHAFTHRMYAKYAILTDRNTPQSRLQKHHHITLDTEFKSDCQVWKEFLTDSKNSVTVCRPMVDLSTYLTAHEIFFYSDASAGECRGMGCVFQNDWLFAMWEPNYIRDYKPSIEYLELLALCAGIFTWEHHLKNVRIIVFCDNQAVVAMVNNLTSGCRNCMHLICLLVLNGLRFNRRVFAHYVTSKSNFLADSLSRGLLQKFRSLALHTMHEFPMEISSTVWPASKLWIH